MTADYGGSGVPVYPQPYYPLIMEGERRFVTGLFGTEVNFVGLQNNGSDNPFIYQSDIDGYYLYIYNYNINIYLLVYLYIYIAKKLLNINRLSYF